MLSTYKFLTTLSKNVLRKLWDIFSIAIDVMGDTVPRTLFDAVIVCPGCDIMSSALCTYALCAHLHIFFFTTYTRGFHIYPLCMMSVLQDTTVFLKNYLKCAVIAQSTGHTYCTYPLAFGCCPLFCAPSTGLRRRKAYRFRQGAVRLAQGHRSWYRERSAAGSGFTSHQSDRDGHAQRRSGERIKRDVSPG